MNPLIEWPVLITLMLAAVIDLRTRRIPNLLTFPLLFGGVMMNIWLAGWAGLGHSVMGIVLAILVVGGLCWLGTLGLGDLKLCAACGAWIGPSAVLFGLLITAMAGGVMAILYAVWKRKVGVALNHTADLLWSGVSGSLPEFRSHRLLAPGAITMPYAPAIAIGMVFSIFAT